MQRIEVNSLEGSLSLATKGLLARPVVLVQKQTAGGRVHFTTDVPRHPDSITRLGSVGWIRREFVLDPFRTVDMRRQSSERVGSSLPSFVRVVSGIHHVPPPANISRSMHPL